jgi:hypothetical protein
VRPDGRVYDFEYDCWSESADEYKAAQRKRERERKQRESKKPAPFPTPNTHFCDPGHIGTGRHRTVFIESDGLFIHLGPLQDPFVIAGGHAPS